MNIIKLVKGAITLTTSVGTVSHRAFGHQRHSPSAQEVLFPYCTGSRDQCDHICDLEVVVDYLEKQIDVVIDIFSKNEEVEETTSPDEEPVTAEIVED